MAKRVHAVGVIFENERGQILVLRRHQQKPEGATWGLAGGKVDPGEDEAAAARREVEEEIGYKIDLSELQIVKTYHWDRDGTNLDFTVFALAFRADGKELGVKSRSEHTELLWASPDDLYRRKDLMIGLYPILEDRYHLKQVMVV